MRSLTRSLTKIKGTKRVFFSYYKNMKRMKKEDYKGDGIYIDLDIEFIPYQKLIYDTEKYLKFNKRYYFYCRHGVKSKEVVMALTEKGYNVTQLI